MSYPEPLHSSGNDWIKFAVGIVSALLGLCGTWLMSRRYAKQFGRSLLFALLAPVFWLVGNGGGLRTFLAEKVKDNRELPDSITDMVLGLIFLFWSFFLQLTLPWFDLKF
jgi:hypothetical protein